MPFTPYHFGPSGFVGLAFFIPVAILYALAAISYIKQSRQKNPPAEAPV